MRISYAIVFVSDMQRSIAFYRDVVGLPLKFQSPGWTEFNTEGATLALHATDSKPEKTDYKLEPPGRCRTGFNVPNIDEFHARMKANNVICCQEPTETFGTRIDQYVDPDGMLFGVSQAR